MKIYIPSYKRSDNCKAAAYLSKGIICCHSFELDLYRENYENEILEMPDELGAMGMGVIRNWILKNSAAKEIVMIDDDVKAIGYWEDNIDYILEEKEVYSFIERAFAMTKELGTVLWGLNLVTDKKAYREYSPFSLSSVVLGPFLGIIKSKLFFDDTLGLKEDYDFSLQVLLRYRKILRFNKYHYVVGHIRGKGGCISYRNSMKEEMQKERLIDKWGSRIVKFRRRDINPIVTVPIRGI